MRLTRWPAIGLVGHAVETVYDGPSGLAAAERLKPDCILLDVGMPDMDVIRSRAHCAPTPRTTTAALSPSLAGGNWPTGRMTQESGFDARLVKPASMEALMRVLEA